MASNSPMSAMMASLLVAVRSGVVALIIAECFRFITEEIRTRSQSPPRWGERNFFFRITKGWLGVRDGIAMSTKVSGYITDGYSLGE